MKTQEYDNRYYWNAKDRDYNEEYRKYRIRKQYAEPEYKNAEVQKAWIMWQEERHNEIQD